MTDLSFDPATADLATMLDGLAELMGRDGHPVGLELAAEARELARMTRELDLVEERDRQREQDRRAALVASLTDEQRIKIAERRARRRDRGF